MRQNCRIRITDVARGKIRATHPKRGNLSSNRQLRKTSTARPTQSAPLLAQRNQNTQQVQGDTSTALMLNNPNNQQCLAELASMGYSPDIPRPDSLVSKGRRNNNKQGPTRRQRARRHHFYHPESHRHRDTTETIESGPLCITDLFQNKYVATTNAIPPTIIHQTTGYKIRGYHTLTLSWMKTTRIRH